MDNRPALPLTDIIGAVNMCHKQPAYHKGKAGNRSRTGHLYDLWIMQGKQSEADPHQRHIQQQLHQRDNALPALK